MQAKKVIISAKGGPEVIKTIEYEVPEPGENEVRIKVEFAGLAYADLLLRKITMPGLPKIPFTPGADITGIIEKIGKNVSGFNVGQRVAALLMSDLGGQAQFVCVKKERILVVPDDISLEKAVCLLVNYLTAYKMLHMVSYLAEKSNSIILVHGGSGGVGSALIQIAVSQGISVISTASQLNIDFVKENGAVGIDYNNFDFVQIIKENYPEGVDAVFDPIGGNYTSRSLRIIKKGGYYIGYGFQNEINKGMFGIMKTMMRFILKKTTTFNKNLLMFQLRDSNPLDYMSDLEKLFVMFKEKKIDPVISEIVPYKKVVQAHDNLEKGNRKGKIIIKMSD